MSQTKAELLQTKHQGELRLGDADSSKSVGFKAPATVSTDVIWTLPAADGSNGYALTTNGSGVLSWSQDAQGIPASGGTFTGTVTFENDVTFDGATAGRDIVFDRSDNALEFADNAKAIFGTGSDLQLHHNGTDSNILGSQGDLYIHNTGSNADDINIRAQDDVLIQVQNGESAINCIGDGAVELYHDGTKKLETTSAGATVSGTVSASAVSANSASFTDNGSAGPVINISGDDGNVWYGRIGNETYHDNVGTGFRFYVADDGDAHFTHYGNAEYRDWSIASHNGTTSVYDIYRTAAGTLYLYNSGNIRLTTTAAGVTVTGSVTDDKGDVRRIPQNWQTSAYTLVASDAGKHVGCNGNVTVPANVFHSSGGDAVTILNHGTSNITITQGSGVTMYNSADATTGNRTLAQKGMATLLFVNGTTCYISGAGLS